METVSKIVGMSYKNGEGALNNLKHAMQQSLINTLTLNFYRS